MRRTTVPPLSAPLLWLHALALTLLVAISGCQPGAIETVFEDGAPGTYYLERTFGQRTFDGEFTHFSRGITMWTSEDGSALVSPLGGSLSWEDGRLHLLPSAQSLTPVLAIPEKPRELIFEGLDTLTLEDGIVARGMSREGMSQTDAEAQVSAFLDGDVRVAIEPGDILARPMATAADTTTHIPSNLTRRFSVAVIDWKGNYLDPGLFLTFDPQTPQATAQALTHDFLGPGLLPTDIHLYPDGATTPLDRLSPLNPGSEHCDTPLYQVDGPLDVVAFVREVGPPLCTTGAGCLDDLFHMTSLGVKTLTYEVVDDLTGEAIMGPVQASIHCLPGDWLQADGVASDDWVDMLYHPAYGVVNKSDPLPYVVTNMRGREARGCMRPELLADSDAADFGALPVEDLAVGRIYRLRVTATDYVGNIGSAEARLIRGCIGCGELQVGDGIPGPGQWTDADRVERTQRWKDACQYNLEQGIYDAYVSAAERRDFYRWFYEHTADQGYETRWPLVAWIQEHVHDAIVDAQGFGPTGSSALQHSRSRGLVRAASRVSFQDAMGWMRALWQGSALAGEEARQWDAQRLVDYENLLAALYGTSPEYSDPIVYPPQHVGAIETGPFNVGGEVPAFDGSLTSADHLIAYGMTLADLFSPDDDAPSTEPPPAPTPGYGDGTLLSTLNPAAGLDTLDGLLDGTFVDIGLVAEVMAELTTDEQRALLLTDQRREALADKVSYGQLVSTFQGLPHVPLMEKIELLEACQTFPWVTEHYLSLRPLVEMAPECERRALVTYPWLERLSDICLEADFPLAMRDLQAVDAPLTDGPDDPAWRFHLPFEPVNLLGTLEAIPSAITGTVEQDAAVWFKAIEAMAKGEPFFDLSKFKRGPVAWFVTDGNPWVGAPKPTGVTMEVTVYNGPMEIITDAMLDTIYQNKIDTWESVWRAEKGVAPDTPIESLNYKLRKSHAAAGRHNNKAKRLAWIEVGQMVINSEHKVGEVHIENSLLAFNPEEGMVTQGKFRLYADMTKLGLPNPQEVVDKLTAEGYKVPNESAIAKACDEYSDHLVKRKGLVDQVTHKRYLIHGSRILIVVGTLFDIHEVWSARFEERVIVEVVGGMIGAAALGGLFSATYAAVAGSGDATPTGLFIHVAGSLAAGGFGAVVGTQIARKFYEFHLDEEGPDPWLRTEILSPVEGELPSYQYAPLPYSLNPLAYW